jgi:Protein of unknown function (DUF2934)
MEKFMVPDDAKARPHGHHASAAVVTLALETAHQRRAMPNASPNGSEDRRAAIAELAYRIAQSRGFIPGHELEDWLAAEKLFNQRLMGEGRDF